MTQTDEYAREIEKHIPEARATVATEDGVHFTATVVSDAFEGKNLLTRHRMVNAALKDRIASGEIHALAIGRVCTSAEWQEKGGES